ncbi:MAG TPA: methylmalonyl-CoA decarboxylase [Candidatus Binataceae bacterium]|nr:methylmalonyl-CoA decarboxylase [Candidatus Binataceae bacterium]
MPLIVTTFEHQIGIIAFDNYAKRNALGAAMIGEMLASMESFKAEGARAVVLRSASNDSVWSSGHDVDELPKADVDPLPYGDPLEQLLRAVKAFPAPVIAMVHGSVWGGACDLVMACDLVIADETSAFAITPAKLGLPYNVDGFLNFMSRLPLAIVKEMFLTADPISAARAERAGLVNQIVPSAELEAHTYAIAKTISTRSPAAIAAFKEAMRVLSEAVAIGPATYEYLQGLRRAVYRGPDYREGIEAFIEKRPPKF